MSVASQINRISNLRNRIRTVLIGWGELSNGNATLQLCTETLESMSKTIVDFGHVDYRGDTNIIIETPNANYKTALRGIICVEPDRLSMPTSDTVEAVFYDDKTSTNEIKMWGGGTDGGGITVIKGKFNVALMGRTNNFSGRYYYMIEWANTIV